MALLDCHARILERNGAELGAGRNVGKHGRQRHCVVEEQLWVAQFCCHARPRVGKEQQKRPARIAQQSVGADLLALVAGCRDAAERLLNDSTRFACAHIDALARQLVQSQRAPTRRLRAATSRLLFWRCCSLGGTDINALRDVLELRAH